MPTSMPPWLRRREEARPAPLKRDPASATSGQRRSCRRLLRGASFCLLLLTVPGLLVAQDSTFTLQDAWTIARRQNPRVLAMAAAADAAAARQPGARRPPDPVLQLGAMNFAVPEFRADMPSSMVPSIQLMQMLPFPGKLALSSRIAEQATEAAVAEADEMWWEMRAEVAAMFWEMYAADRQLDVMRETLALLRDFEQIARAMYASGSGQQTDVLRAGVEAARMRADLVRMEAMRAASAARLNGMLQRPAATPIARTAVSPLPLNVPGADSLRTRAAGARALLRASRARVTQSDHRSALMRREIWPDLTVGVQYGQRPMAEGTERMGSVMLGFSLPVFAGSRQYRLREEAEAMERMADAELAEAQAKVDADITGLLAELDRSRSLVGLYRSEVLPQARAAVESALSAYRVGNVDFLMLLDAQMARNRYEQELYGLVAEYGAALARLESVVGIEIRPEGPALMEAR